MRLDLLTIFLTEFQPTFAYGQRSRYLVLDPPDEELSEGILLVQDDKRGELSIRGYYSGRGFKSIVRPSLADWWAASRICMTTMLVLSEERSPSG